MSVYQVSGKIYNAVLYDKKTGRIIKKFNRPVTEKELYKFVMDYEKHLTDKKQVT